jgi:hypothetical protein
MLDAISGRIGQAFEVAFYLGEHARRHDGPPKGPGPATRGSAWPSPRSIRKGPWPGNCRPRGRTTSSRGYPELRRLVDPT